MVTIMLIDCLAMTSILIDSIRRIMPDIVSGLILSIVSGLIVWFGTERYMRGRDARLEFVREQQDYSRWLDWLQGELELTSNSVKGAKQIDTFETYTRIKRLIHGQPIIPKMVHASDQRVLENIHDNLNNIEKYFLSHRNSSFDSCKLDDFASKIQLCKQDLIGLAYVR